MTVLDGMILVAASAAGFALIRATGLSLSIPAPASLPRLRYFAVVEHALSVFTPLLTTWTLSFPVIRLLQPRPRLRWLARQPGMAGCCAASLFVLVEASWILLMATVVRQPVARGYLGSPERYSLQYVPEVAFSVAGAWLTLAMGGRWRPEPSWIDRLGRILGGAWIAVYLTRRTCILLIGTMT